MTRKTKDDGLCYIHRLQRLKDEYSIDAWVTVEDSRLKYYKKHQLKYRKERQQGQEWFRMKESTYAFYMIFVVLIINFN